MTQLDAEWVRAPEVQVIFDMLEKAGHEGWFVGGCVRNTILGEPVDDVDIATVLTPDEVIAHLEKAGLKAVPTGVEHGTVAVLDGEGRLAGLLSDGSAMRGE